MAILGRVCRQWREVMLWEEWWRPAAETCMPLIRQEAARKLLLRGRSHRQAVLDFERSFHSEDSVNWSRRLRTSVDIFIRGTDTAPPTYLLTAVGRLSPQDEGNTITATVGGYDASMCGAGIRPSDFGSADLDHLLGALNDEDPNLCLVIRVRLLDLQSGHTCVLYHGAPALEVHAEDDGGRWVRAPSYAAHTVPGLTGEDVRVRLDFKIYPQVGQGDGVPPAQRVYRLAEDDGPGGRTTFWLSFDGVPTEAMLGGFLQALLVSQAVGCR
jgi:hypothetical protein